MELCFQKLMTTDASLLKTMRLYTILLVLLLWLVADGTVHGMDVICQIQLQLPIESALAKELRSCSVFIVNSVSFDIDKSTILSREELSRIDTIKKSNASADVLLTIVLPFNVTLLSVHQQLSERINIVLRDNLLDGVDLDYDIALLDYYEQLRYGQFLRQLRTALGDKYVISTTIGCHTLGSSRSLLKQFNEQLDLVSVVGVNMLEDELADRAKEEFMVREYETEYIERLISAGLHPAKIVLSILTVGVVFNPGSYRSTRSPQRSHVGVLSYGQICELLREKQAKCGSKRPTCSLFAGRGAVVYDSEESVRIRTEQAHQLGVRGVLMLPNYDDTENVCNEGPFPLFRSLIEGVGKEDIKIKLNKLICDGKQRYGDVEDRRLYYTFYNGRFQQNRCEEGTNFNEPLQLCISTLKQVTQTVPTDTNGEESTEEPFEEYSAPFSTSTHPSTVTNAEVEQTISTTSPAMQTLASALAYLDSIIYRALGMVERLELLEQSRRNDGTQPEVVKVIKSTAESETEEDSCDGAESGLVEERVLPAGGTLLDGLLIPAGLPHFR